METVYLGFLDFLQEILREIFNSVLMPVLKTVFNILVSMIGELIKTVFSGIFLRAWVILLKLIDFMEDVFTIFSGMSKLTINGELSNQGILQYLFGLGTVQKAFLMITGISVILCIGATLVAVIRSLADSPFENKKPLSAVFKTVMQSILTFLMLQFACIFAIQMVTQVLLQINAGLGEVESVSLGDTLFFILASPHAKVQGAALNTFSSGGKYADLTAVERCFDYMNFDWLICGVVTATMLLILLATIIQSIQRLLMIVILYIISPLFVGYMPIDEGKSFNQWRDTFVAYLISAFSPIITMRLYMMFLPILMGTDGKNLTFPDGVSMTIIKILFILGGSFAIFTSRNMLVKIVNPSLGSQLDENSRFGAFIQGMATQKILGK
ncbi:MAG: hypothetical protein K6G43_06650 [Lachnospiraceae bacterium]|nr:hypothetical protein [Lachnospiraceae bacterium]